MQQHIISLYAIVRDADGKYFGGFDPAKGEALIVDSVINAKLFTNKFDINLRPDEKMVEVMVTMNESNTQVTAPFKPRRRADSVHADRAPRVDGGRRLTD